MSTALAILPRLWACQAPEEAIQPEPKVRQRTGPKAKPVMPEVAFYRKYTEAMLKRYMRLSMSPGRAPSLLGRELFRGAVTSYRIQSFDDVVIFAHDVENCIGMLDRSQQHLITRIALQAYTHQEVATQQREPRRTIVRRYEETLDLLTAIFLDRQLLEPQKACQEEGVFENL